jgi:uncharacterized NAD-dependent epimerase/dehydratase family protein
LIVTGAPATQPPAAPPSPFGLDWSFGFRHPAFLRYHIAMIFELPYKRMLILTEGKLGVFSSKTGVSVMRYRRGDCAGVLDSAYAGRRIEECLPGTGITGLPIFANVADAMTAQPDSVLIGIAPTGGALPPVMRRHVVDALENGLSIISGLHTILSEDRELVELAARHHAKLHDLRIVGPIEQVARALARNTRCKRVLTVGTDCNVGKMVTSLELRRAAAEAGLDAVFVATGQTGIMIEGWGLAVDHAISDFTAGAAEMLVQRVADRQICFVEGQGSITNPSYSGVTLSLVHGTCPDAMVMVVRPDRTGHNGWPDCPVAPVEVQIALYEQILAPLHPGKVVAVAVNTHGMSAEDAQSAIRALSARTHLPAADPIRDGCGELLAAVRRHVGL